MRHFLLVFLAALVGCVAGPGATDSEPEGVVLMAEERPAEIPATGLTLEGVLSLPERVEGEDVPSVVFVHGSGPNSRDPSVGGQLNMYFGGVEVTPYSDVRDALVEAGVAVLLYDKRTCTTQGSLCANDYPIPSADVLVSDFAGDAVSASAWLREQDGIDPSGIVVVGHSQGAALVPTILAEDIDLRGGVSLAGNYRPIDALLRYQLDFSIELMEESGASVTVIDSTLADLTEMVEALESLRAGTFAGTTVGGMPVPFWEDWMAIGDARPGLMAAESRPILSVIGDYDWNIPADPELPLWEEAGAEPLLLPCVTHALNCVTDEDYGDHVDPTLLEHLVEWLHR
ncbi:MAG TPA: hypothetical protein DIU15_15625 [Deltaproteobacteria bacterium]|nr:hypothetical protein [Deltaproteobacteria bacterium]HCP47471.1 hypothetical protein [Deltaproteobacteria bacterium]